MVYCIPDYCTEDKHCCGINQCCSNFSFTPYIVLAVVVFVGILIYWSWLLLRRRRTDSMKVCDIGDDEPLMNSNDIRTVD